jgi:hypothetical protein
LEVRKNAAPLPPGDGDDAAGRVIADGGKEESLRGRVRVLEFLWCKRSLEGRSARISLETGTTWLAAASPVEARRKS